MNNNYLTFKLSRKCQFCNKAIADQKHAATKFCEWEELPDGSIKSCKDDYHAEKNKLKNIPYQEIVEFHKTTSERICQLLKDKGDTASIDQLDMFAIDLNRRVRTVNPASQKTIFYFVDYALTRINETTFKITTHDNSNK
ncbi:hypothetical protein BH11BAC3_BH11BAC3_19770 [soil metagenome]